MNRKELLDCPMRDWDGDINHATGVYIIPTRRIRFVGCCDDVSLKGANFRIDCNFQTKLVHIWNRHLFTITHDLSSIDFIEEGIKYE